MADLKAFICRVIADINGGNNGDHLPLWSASGIEVRWIDGLGLIT
jgi:hypothetical protein